MKSKRQWSLVLAAVITLSAIPATPVLAQTSRLVPFSNVVTTLPPSTPAQALTIQLWDVPTGGAAPLFAESQTLDVDANKNISFVFGSATPGGLDPVNFPSGSSRYLDVVDATGATVLAARMPLNAATFALSPGPAGPAGPKGDKGDPGAPGGVNTVTGDSSILVGGTTTDPVVSVAPNGVNDSKIANGAISPAKINGTAATLGANTFLGSQTVVTLPGSYGIFHSDGFLGGVKVASWVGTDTTGVQGGYLGTQSAHPLFFFTGGGWAQMALTQLGNFGIGTVAPAKKLDVQGGSARVSGLLGTRGLDPDSGYPPGIAGGIHTWDVYAEGLIGVGQNGALNALMRNDGLGSFKIVEIKGADFSERFDVRETQNAIEPGMLMVIDPETPGQLVVSSRAYDRRVAGIISGAGGINAGVLMGQPGTLANGKQPVALSGRVYVWADASKAPIVPGDLLTTSNVPGHAMKVGDRRKAQGAVIGKAMTGLKDGKGLVLALVALQ